MAEAAIPRKTPAQLVRRLRVQLGDNGRPITQRELAEMIGASGYQRIIAWEKGKSAISEQYAEALARVSQRTPEPLAPEDFLDDRDDLESRLAKLEEALRELPAQVAAELSRSDDAAGLSEREQRVADQLRAQSQLLVELAAAAAEMREAARDLQAAANPARRRPA